MYDKPIGLVVVNVLFETAMAGNPPRVPPVGAAIIDHVSVCSASISVTQSRESNDALLPGQKQMLVYVSAE